MKPILIDALHINMGGAFMILDHLVNHLTARGIKFTLLKDARCPKLESESKVPKVIVLCSSLKNRYSFYRGHGDDFRSVLCLGNIPPPIRLHIPTHTYSHNVSLLKVPKDYHFKLKTKAYIKKFAIKCLSRNTTDWIVQTPYTSSLVKKTVSRKGQKVYVYPFFTLPEKLKAWSNEPRTDYIFVGECTHAKGHQYLIEAWRKLHRLGIRPALHLTTRATVAKQWIAEALAEGVNIVNHGYIPFEEVIGLYHKSKATVFPSLNESLGLGIVEAMAGGCDVIGCDLPYTHCVCQPSVLFKPQDPDSIADAVIKYERESTPRTMPLIEDKVEDFIDFLLQ